MRARERELLNQCVLFGEAEELCNKEPGRHSDHRRVEALAELVRLINLYRTEQPA